MSKTKKTATAQPTTLSDIAKVVGKICDLLEPYDQGERKKIVDLVTTLAMASPPDKFDLSALVPKPAKPPQPPSPRPTFHAPGGPGIR